MGLCEEVIGRDVRTFQHILSEAGFSHNTLRKHLDELVDQGLVARRKRPRKGPGRPLFTRKGREMLRSLGLEAVDQILPVMDTLDRQIAVISGSLRRMCGENPRASLLPRYPVWGTTSPSS